MVKKEEEILHSGRIVEMTPQTISVEIISESACASCHAASLCRMSESKTTIVEGPAQLGYEPGEEVWVIMKKSMGIKAVTLGYVFPLAILVGVLMGCLVSGANEITSGLLAIGAVAVYYIVLWLRRDKLRNEYTFYIKKK